MTGKGSTTGQFLIDHQGISKTSFTGSTEIGRTIAEASAKKLIPSTQELGGKSANIFFPDMPWAKAMDAIKLGALDFIVKPFKADRIVQTVNKILPL